jgi:hypothetical protein
MAKIKLVLVIASCMVLVLVAVAVAVAALLLHLLLVTVSMLLAAVVVGFKKILEGSNDFASTCCEMPLKIIERMQREQREANDQAGPRT